MLSRAKNQPEKHQSDWLFQSDVIRVVGAAVGSEYFRFGGGRMRADMRGVLLLSTATTTPA